RRSSDLDVAEESLPLSHERRNCRRFDGDDDGLAAGGRLSVIGGGTCRRTTTGRHHGCHDCRPNYQTASALLHFVPLLLLRWRVCFSDVPELIEGILEGHPIPDGSWHLLLRLRHSLRLAEHFRNELGGDDDCSVLVSENEVAGTHYDPSRGRPRQVHRLLVVGDTPATDRLDRCAVCPEHRKSVFSESAGVSDPSVDDRADRTSLSHAQRDQLPEVADPLTCAAPDGDLIRPDAVACLHLLRVAAPLVGDHLPGDRVGPARDPFAGDALDLR